MWNSSIVHVTNTITRESIIDSTSHATSMNFQLVNVYRSGDDSFIDIQYTCNLPPTYVACSLVCRITDSEYPNSFRKWSFYSISGLKFSLDHITSP